MNTPLAVLIVEDSESDAELIVRLLGKAGYNVSYERVETADQMRAALEQQVWNIVIADYRLPQFDALAALKLLQVTSLDVPFVVVSGTIGEETAVAMMRAGAHDYLMKNNLARLAPAVERELHEAETWRGRKRAEESLRALSLRQEAILSAVPDILMEVDNNKVYTWANQAGLEFFGEDVIGQEAAFYFEGEQDTYNVVQPLFNGSENVIYVESWQRRKDGQKQLLAWWCRVLKDENGNVVGALSSGRDITERKRAEEALRESEVRYRTLVETSPDGISLTDLNSKFIMVNWRLVDLHGYASAEEMLGTSAFDLIAPEDRLRAMENMPKTLETGTFRDVEYTLLRKDGARFSAEVSASVIVDAQGKPQALIGVTRDITERKRTEEALWKVGERYRGLFEDMPVGLYRSTSEGQILDANPALVEMLGYPDWKSFVAVNTADLFVSPEDREKQQVLLEREGILRHFEMQLRRRDGTLIWVRDNARAILDTEGRVTYYEGSLEDITERKRMEETLRDRVIALRTLTEIDREIIAATEPQGILDLVCCRAAELVGAPKSIITIQSAADSMALAASYGLRDPAAARQEFTRHWQVELSRPATPGERDGRALNDISVSSPYGPDFGAREDIRAYANAPLVSGAARQGALMVFDTAPREWTVDELQILNMLAGQAAVALEKVRLYQAAQNRATQLAMLNDIGQALTSTLDLDRILTLLLDKVRQALGAEACSVALIEPPLSSPPRAATEGRIEGGHELVFRQAAGEVSQTVVGVRLQPGQGIAGWVALHKQSVLVPDAAADPRFYGEVDNRTSFITRDLVCVPLMIRNTVTGVIELVNKRQGKYGEDDVKLLESVAAQAAVALENARLFENERAGRQRLEMLYRIGQTINSTLDADAILDWLTEEAMRATRATHGSALVARPESDCFERRSLRGYSPDQAERARSLPLSLRQGANGRAYWTQQVVYLRDAWDDPDYFPLIPETRSELAVPILHGSQVIGNLDLQSPDVDAFRDVDLDFMLALTNQVAIALENARLFQETRHRLGEMSVVSNVALVGAAGRPFDETVARATEALTRLWPDALLGFLFLDEADQSLRPHPSYHGAPPETIAIVRIPVDKGITGWAVRERQPVRVGDVLADPRYFGLETSTRSEMAAPLVAGERIFGVINVESRSLDAFSGDDLRLLTTLAGQLATIFEKARLDAELETERDSLARRVEERTAELRLANEQLRQAHEQVSRALEIEKELGELKSRFISMTSHEFRTPLTGILSAAEMLEEYGDQWSQERKLVYLRRIQASVQHMTDLLNDVLVIGRAEAGKLDLRPAPLDLLKFCQELMEELQLTTGNQHTLTFASVGECVQAHMDENLLRHILINLLSNAIKYSPQGGEVLFTLICQADQAIFRVQDQGIGIPPEDQARLFDTFHRASNVRNIPGTGLGLAIVKRSVDAQGGTIRVESQVGAGTTVTVMLPLGAANDE